MLELRPTCEHCNTALPPESRSGRRSANPSIRPNLKLGALRSPKRQGKRGGNGSGADGAMSVAGVGVSGFRHEGQGVGGGQWGCAAVAAELVRARSTVACTAGWGRGGAAGWTQGIRGGARGGVGSIGGCRPYTLSITWSFTRVPQECEPYVQGGIPAWTSPIKHPSTGRWITSHVINQDIVAWVGQGTIADRSRETLGASDSGITMLRRRFFAELQALAAGQEPKGLIRDPQKKRQCRTASCHLRGAHCRHAPRAVREGPGLVSPRQRIYLRLWPAGGGAPGAGPGDGRGDLLTVYVTEAFGPRVGALGSMTRPTDSSKSW